MKRILSLVLSTLLMLSLIPLSAVSVTATEGENATASALSDVADYEAFMAQISDGTISKSLRLTGDIVFPENTVITSQIATLADGVVIDGNGHSIKGFTMSASSADMALFAVASGASVTIKNLTVGSDTEGGDIAYSFAPGSAAETDGESYAVLVAELASGTTLNVQNVDIYAAINRSNDAHGARSAGFVGLVSGTASFKDCTFNGSISNAGAWGGSRVAGFVAKADATATLNFVGCVNNATITGNQRAAGLVSDANCVDITMRDCVNNGKVKGCMYTGGLIGELNRTVAGTYVFVRCQNNGAVECTSREVGGIIGHYATTNYKTGGAELALKGCINTGSISSPGTNGKEGATGGLIGYAHARYLNYVNIESCVNLGDVTDKNDASGTDGTGGIIGYLFTQGDPDIVDIENCVNAGTIKGGLYTGGLVGRFKKWADKVDFINSINLGDVSNTNEAGFVGGLLGYHNDFDADSSKNTNYYTVTGGGYFCTLDGANVCTGVTDAGTIDIPVYATADAALVDANKYCVMGDFAYSAENGFIFTAAPEAPRFVGVQLSSTYPNQYGDSAMNVRFVAVLDNTDLSEYGSIGFKLTAIAADGTESKLNDITGTDVYSSILASTDNSIKAYTAEQLGGEYIFALAIEGVPAVGTVAFNGTAYAIANDGTTEICDPCTYSVQFTDGVCTSVSLVLD